LFFYEFFQLYFIRWKNTTLKFEIFTETKFWQKNPTGNEISKTIWLVTPTTSFRKFPLEKLGYDI